MNKKVTFFISLIVSLACITIIMSYVSTERFRIKGEYEPVLSIRATQDIPKLTILQDNMFEAVEIPKKYSQPGALKEKLDIRGKISDAPIKKGEIVTWSKIVKPNKKTGPSQHIEPGKRAVTLAVTDVTGIAGLIRPFDHVDVIVFTEHGGNDFQDKRAHVLGQDILVLATGENLGTGVPSSTEKDDVTDAIKFVDPAERRYLNITLSVTPKQAMGLSLAQQFGTISFLLRPAFNTKNFELEGMMIKDVLGLKAPPVKQISRPAWMTLRNSSINF
jgi:pilus assembly protein CpaB